MSYAILRTAKLKTLGNISGSLAHTYRTIDTPNANSELTQKNINSIENKDRAFEEIKNKLPKQHRKNGVLCIEYMITGSPEWEGWHTEKQTEYFNNAIAWLEEKHGKQNVVMTGIQLDETTPHLVAYVIPYDKKGKMNAREFLGGREKLNKMQTNFAENVGAKFGLERGKEGSKAQHKTIKKFYTDIQELTDGFDLPSPVAGKFGFGGETTVEYKQRVEEIIIDKINTLASHLTIAESELAEKSNAYEFLVSETKNYMTAKNKVGVEYHGKLNQRINDFVNDLVDERKNNFRDNNLSLLTVHDNDRFTFDAKIKFIDNQQIGKIITDKNNYLRQVADILAKSEIERPSIDDIEKYVFAKKFLNALSDMEQSGELIARVKASNADYQKSLSTPIPAPSPTPVQPQQADFVQVSKSKSSPDR